MLPHHCGETGEPGRIAAVCLEDTNTTLADEDPRTDAVQVRLRAALAERR